MLFVLEPVKLVGKGDYNLNNLKQIQVTQSYLGLDQEVRKCQNEESLDTCITNQYLDTVQKKCGCLPFQLRLKNQVHQQSIELQYLLEII